MGHRGACLAARAAASILRARRGTRGRAQGEGPGMTEDLMALVQKGVGDVAAMVGGALVALGDRLGLYAAMADGEPVTAAELAGRTGTVERYVGEWLAAQAASGFLLLDPDGRYRLP